MISCKKLLGLVLLTLALNAVMTGTASGQNEEDLVQFLKAPQEDASNLIEAYVSPIIKGLSYGMTQGWYHTAKAHKSLGVDIGVSMHIVQMPSSENYFDPNSFLTSQTSFTSGLSNDKAPTVFGPKEGGSYTTAYDVNGDGTFDAASETLTIPGPEGLEIEKEIGMAAVPVPMAQIGIGIIKNTDLKIRFVPEQEVGSSKVSMLGFGVLHDIKQHISGIKLMPFDLAVLAAFNTVKGNTDLAGVEGLPKPDGYTGSQEMDYKLNSWVLQGIISKKISVLTLYAGFGYAAVKTNLDVKGQYVIAEVEGEDVVITNPVSIDYKNNTARFTGGLRLKFGPFYLNGEYTFQKFNTYSAGLGFSFR